MDVAKAEGATIAVGGKRPDRDDLKMVYSSEANSHYKLADASMRIVQEEVFGPCRYCREL